MKRNSEGRWFNRKQFGRVVGFNGAQISGVCLDRSTGSEMVFNDVIEKIGMTIDAAGVVVIVTGAAIVFVVGAVRLSRRESDVYRRFRQQLGQAILLGLELLVAGDIIRTVATSPSLNSVAILAAIVLIRTFLSFSLEVETTGRWPWQKHEVAAS